MPFFNVSGVVFATFSEVLDSFVARGTSFDIFFSTWEPYWSFEADMKFWGVLQVSLRPLPGTISEPKLAPKSYKNYQKCI